MNQIRAGIVGYGVGKMYAAALKNVSYYYPNLPPIELVSIATATEKSGHEAVNHFGFTKHTTDYLELLEDDEINVVILATPIDLHKEMLLAALKSDKALYADKPLTANLAEAREVLALAKKLGRDAQIIFQFRYCPALQLAHQYIKEGRLGDIYSYRITYFRSSYISPDKSLGWKGSFARSGGGVINDYASHLIDLLTWLVGTPTSVTAQTRTFLETRPDRTTGAPVPIDTDDHVIILGQLPGGAIGTIEAGRMITGAKNDMGVEIYGEKGSLKWRLMDTNYLYFTEQATPASQGGWMQLPTIQTYPEAVLPGSDVPVGMMRFYIAGLADFLGNALAARPFDPDIRQGVRVQAVIEAALESVRNNRWIQVPEI